VVTNSLGSVRSANATVTVNPRIRIVQQPTGTNVALQASIRLTVQASGAIPLTYQWFRNDFALPGQTNATLLIASATLTDAGEYRAEIESSSEVISSEIVEVTVSLDQSQAGGVLAIAANSSGAGSSVNIVAQGLPATTYEIQVSSDLRSGNWITIRTVIADENGQFTIDPPGTQGGYWFIRTVRRQ